DFLWPRKLARRAGRLATAGGSGRGGGRCSHPLLTYNATYCNQTVYRGLKIRVSLVQFRPWARTLSSDSPANLIGCVRGAARAPDAHATRLALWRRVRYHISITRRLNRFLVGIRAR